MLSQFSINPKSVNKIQDESTFGHLDIWTFEHLKRKE